MTSHKSTPGVGDAAWTDQERELLGAARQDRMPSYLEARMREALELQLGAAGVSGTHDVVPRASSPREAGHTIQPVESSPVSALDRSARVSQLFASKLPLWGVLSALALGSFAYFGLRSPAPESVSFAALHPAHANDPTAAQPNVSAGAAPTTNAVDSALAARSVERSARDGVTSEASAAAQSGNGPAPGVVRDPATSRATTAVVSGSGRAPSARASSGTRAAVSGSDRAQRTEPDVERDPGGTGVRGAAAGGGGRARGGVLEGSGSRASNATVSGGSRAQRDAVGGDAPAADSGEGRGSAVQRAEASQAQGVAVDELRVEAELLDGARRALSRGALQDARVWLARYSARFEHGALRPERDVLGIELDMRTGAERAAEAHAARFLASYPQHPLRERVRDLVAGRAAKAAE